VVGCADPFAAVNGKGIAKMKAAGIEVTQNISEDDCKELNKRFFIFHGQQRPYIILKWAQTADGFIAGAGKATIISNELSNRLVHKWRGEEAAIMIGTNTARIDDPSLTTRLWKGKNPVRIVVDMDLQLPSSLQLFTDGGKTILLNKIKESQAHDTSYIKIGSSDVVQETCRVLHRASIQSVLIEGGALLLQTFIDAGLWDEARVIRSSMNIKNGLTAPILTNFHLQNEIHLLTDTISFYKNEITK
jgi:diaminohydroxyphosphoribosylaminopyrimidine deaminase/5-amino-6-(5-phosphoribosylamino)uracil reductase